MESNGKGIRVQGTEILFQQIYFIEGDPTPHPIGPVLTREQIFKESLIRAGDRAESWLLHTGRSVKKECVRAKSEISRSFSKASKSVKKSFRI
jgi:hypothetical protein